MFGVMSDTPAFLDAGRPPVPDLVVPRGITPFFLPRRPVRGRLLRLGPLADAILTRHTNPPAVTRLAGQALALAAGLAAALKFQGSFSLQAKGDGPVSMLLADCTDTGALRFYARTQAERLDALLAQTPRPGADELLGNGYLAFTVDQGEDQNRHQGIVTIEGGSLAEMALHYFRTSEQLRYFVHLACEHGSAGWSAGALILEKIAGAGGIDQSMNEAAQEESWNTATGPGRHADRRRATGRVANPRTSALSPVPHRGRCHRPGAGAVLWLPLLPRAAGRDSRGFPP